ncbi:hypothetical protein L6R50_10005 [Myxococcota bacterium]|nr:hypothetical protein [Myxococcota bacterium]
MPAPRQEYPPSALSEVQGRPLASLVPWLRARLLGLELDPAPGTTGEPPEAFVEWAARHGTSPEFRARIEDAIALLLKGFVAPQEEADPALLARLLGLVHRLRILPAREPLAALVVGGHFDGLGPDGPLGTGLRVALLDLRREQEPFTDFWRALEGSLPRDVLGGHPAAPGATGGSPAGGAGGEEGPDASAPPVAGDETLPGAMVPQIADPIRAFELLDEVRAGRVGDRGSYARAAEVSPRHADFVARAAASLGLLWIHIGGGYSPTEAGRDLPPAADPAGAVVRRGIVGAHPLVAPLIPVSDAGVDLRSRARELIEARTPLRGTTADRRAMALARWVEWWKEGGA